MKRGAVILLTLALAGCWGGETDANIEQIVGFVRGKCNWIVDAVTVGAMLAVPNPSTPPTVKAIGTAICVALNDETPQEGTTALFGWGEPCPEVNGVCIEAVPDDGN